MTIYSVVIWTYRGRGKESNDELWNLLLYCNTILWIFDSDPSADGFVLCPIQPGASAAFKKKNIDFFVSFFCNYVGSFSSIFGSTGMAEREYGRSQVDCKSFVSGGYCRWNGGLFYQFP